MKTTSWAQIAVVSGLFGAYAAYYVTKKNYPYVLAEITASDAHATPGKPHFEPAAAAAMGSLHETMCAVSKIGGGVIADALPPTELLAGSLAVTAVANLAVAGTTWLPLMIGAWGVNGFFQAFGWAAVGRIFFAWFPDPATRGYWYSLLSASQNTGAAVASVLIPASIAAAGDWRAALLVPAAVGLVVAVAVQLFLPASPNPSAASAVAAKDAHRDGDEEEEEPESGQTASGGGWEAARGVLTDWRQWVLGIAYLFLSIVRSGTADWAVNMLGEEQAGGLTAGEVGTVLVAMEAGGFAGALVAGFASDALTGGRRAPVMLFLSLCAAPVAWGLFGGGPGMREAVRDWGLPEAATDVQCTAALYFLLGITTFAPHALLGLAAREIAGPKAISTAGGFVKGLGQFGSAMAGSPLALVQQSYGWGGVATGWAACMLVASACFAVVMPAERVRRKDKDA